MAGEILGAEFFGGGQPLVVRGIPQLLEEKYDELLRKAAWGTYDGMWRAAASGIGKGIIAAVGIVMTVSAAVGSLVSGNTLAEGAMRGLDVGFGVLTSTPTALGIFALGAIAGATFDISRTHNKLFRELAELRQEMRQHEREGNAKERETGAGRGQSPETNADLSNAQSQENAPAGSRWQDRVASRNGQQTTWGIS